MEKNPPHFSVLDEKVFKHSFFALTFRCAARELFDYGQNKTITKGEL